MISVQNIIDKDKNLFSIVFDKHVLKHLKCKCGDHITVLQSLFKHYFFLITKAENGYRITRHPKMKKTYQVDVNYKFNYISEFDLKECNYFKKNNGIIRISVK